MILAFNALICIFVVVAIQKNNMLTIAFAFYLQLVNILCLAVLSVVSVVVTEYR